MKMAEPQKHIIFDNINLYVIKDVKYKTVYACTHLYRTLKREEVTLNSLLSKVLKSATASYHSIKELSVYAENLFGCIYDVNVSKRANIQSIVSSVNVISDRYTGENCENESFKLMLDFLFDPYVFDDSFCSEYVISQKSNLIDDIDGLINDKRSYANVRCIEEMCKNEPNSIIEIGYRDDLDSIDEKNLYTHYKNIIFSSPIDIFVIGDVDSEKLIKYFKDYFSKYEFNISPLKIACSSKECIETKYVEDNMDVKQGKLAMGLRTGITVNDAKYYPLLVGNSIFGSGAHSKLFNNVREKMSLCYYAYSRLDKYNGLMLVGSGIEFENFTKAKDAVIAELDNVKGGNFTDEELAIAKEYIISTYRSYEDSPGYLADYYLACSFSDKLPSLTKACELVNEVTREKVLEAFSSVKLDTVYFLNGKES